MPYNPSHQGKSVYSGRYIFYLFLIALAARLCFYILVRDYPLLHVQSLDEKYYLDIARKIADGNLLSNSADFFMDPFYGYFLGSIFFIFGDSLTIIRLIQIILDSVNIFLIFAIGRAVWDTHAGIFAALIWSMYSIAFYYSLLILKVTLAVTGILIFVLILLKITENKRKFGFFLAGLIAAILVYIRANFILVIPLTLIFCFFIERSTWRISMINWGCFLSGAMLLFSLNALHTYATTGHPMFLITSSGRILYSCNNPGNTTGLYDVPLFAQSDPLGSEYDYHREAERRLGKKLSAREASNYWRNETFRVWREHPRIIPVLILNKLKWTIANYEIPMNQSYQFMAEFSGADKWPLPNYAFVVALGLPGLMIGLRRRKQVWWLMIPIVTITATLMVFCVSSRFRMPMVPFLMIGTGIFFECGWRWIKEGYWKNIILPVLVAITIFSVSMMISPPESDGHKEFGLAKAFFLRKDYHNAKRLAMVAQKKYPENVDLYILLGHIAKIEGRRDDSMAHYQTAVSMTSDDFTANYDLGMLYLDAGKPEQAIDYLEKSLTIRRYSIGMLNLARAYEETGDRNGAINYYKRFIKAVGPDDPRYEMARKRIAIMETLSTD